MDHSDNNDCLVAMATRRQKWIINGKSCRNTNWKSRKGCNIFLAAAFSSSTGIKNTIINNILPELYVWYMLGYLSPYSPNHSQEHSLSFFSKFENYSTSKWLNHMVVFLSNVSKYRKIWRTRLRMLFRMIGKCGPWSVPLCGTGSCNAFNWSPSDKFWTLPKLRKFAGDNFTFDENSRKSSKKVENAVGKGEIAYYKQFLLVPQCF